jgi:hypothetical protein
MSEAWMPFQPAIDEPSKAWPDSNLSAPKCLTGTPHVLLLAAGVGEAEVDELDFVFLNHLHDVLRGHITHS